VTHIGLIRLEVDGLPAATAAKSKKRVNRTPGPALVRIIARVALRPSSGRELRLAAYVILGEVGSIFIFRDLIGRLFFLH
jgi:hypothetical protein